MRFTTYTKYRPGLLDALNLEALLEHLTDFLMDGGFAGGPHFHPYWGWSGTEDTSSYDALQRAILDALIESGQFTPEMLEELRGEGEGDEEVQRRIAQLIDDIVQKLVEEGYLTLEGGKAMPPTEEMTGQGHIDEARDAARSVNFGLTRKGMDFLGYRALRNLLSASGTSSFRFPRNPAAGHRRRGRRGEPPLRVRRRAEPGHSRHPPERD